MYFLSLDRLPGFANCVPQCLPCSRRAAAYATFDFRPHLLNRIEVRRIRWQVPEPGPDFFQSRGNSLRFMTGEIIHHHHIAAPQLRRQNPLDESRKSLRVRRPFEDQPGRKTLQPNGTDHGRYPVMAIGYRIDQPFSFGGSTRTSGPIGLGTGLVHED